MLKVRIIPVVLLQGYSVVKTIRFKERRNLGNPITVAKIYNTRNVDELVLLDIDASKTGSKIDSYTIEEVASECFMPLTVGGGLRTIADISEVLAQGADKVAINTGALENGEFITRASSVFGAQCIVASIDVILVDGRYEVFCHPKGSSTGLGAVDFAVRMEELGAGEILLNSVDRDGMMDGCDTELVKLISGLVSIPVIATGGVSEPADAVALVQAGADAIGASSIFHFTSHTPNSLKNELGSHGYPIRTEPEIDSNS